MDRTLRRLERAAQSGDWESQKELVRWKLRLGLILPDREKDPRPEARRIVLRAWEYFSYFQLPSFLRGKIRPKHEIYVRNDAVEEEVRRYLNRKYYGGNWKSNSLKRGKKKKVKREQETLILRKELW